MNMKDKKTGRQRFIEDTQMFQRIAGVSETSAEDLGRDWDTMRPGWRKRAAESAREHCIIQDLAIKAGKGRKN